MLIVFKNVIIVIEKRDIEFFSSRLINKKEIICEIRKMLNVLNAYDVVEFIR